MSTDNERDASLSSHATGNFVSSESLGIASGISRVAKGTTAPGGRAEDAISPRTKFLKLFGITTADTDPGEYTQSIAEVPAPLNDAAVWTGGWWGSLCNRFWEQR